MSRRVVLVALAIAFAAPACARSPRAERSSAPVATAAAPAGAALTVAWSTPSEVVPAEGAADGRGAVMTVDHQGVIAFDRRGLVQWQVPLDGASVGTPVLVGDRVVLPVSRVDGSGGCIGLDRRSGTAVWTYESIGTGGVAVAHAGPYVICVMRDGLTAALSPVYGIAHWAFTFASNVDSKTVLVADGTAVAVDETAGLFAFTVREGLRWVTTFRAIDTGRTRNELSVATEGAFSAPAVVGAGEFAIAASGPGRLCVADLRAGSVKRIAVRGAGPFDPATAPLVVRRLVIIVNRDGVVAAIDLGTGRSRWTARTSAPVPAAHPVAVGDTVVVPTTRGAVGFRLSDGSPVRLPAGSEHAAATVAEPDSGGSGTAGVVVLGRAAPGGWIARWEPR